MKKNWIPEFAISIEMYPLFSFRNEIMYFHWDRMIRTYYRFHLSIWKWRWEFQIYQPPQI